MKKYVLGFMMMASATVASAQSWETQPHTIHRYEGGRAMMVDNSRLIAAVTSVPSAPASTEEAPSRRVHIYEGGRASVVDNSRIWVASSQTTGAPTQVIQASQPEPNKRAGVTLKQVAIGSAFADAITTKVMIKSGGYERNPLIKPTTSGLLTAAAVNWAVVELVDRSDLEPTTKKNIMQAGSAMWTGAAVNNLMIALSASNPVSLAAGVAAGVYMWNLH